VTCKRSWLASGKFDCAKAFRLAFGREKLKGLPGNAAAVANGFEAGDTAATFARTAGGGADVGAHRLDTGAPP
jgi:hypothetical protein